MPETKVDLGAGAPGYYPEGAPKKSDAATAAVEADIAALGPYLEGDYLAQLGLDTLSPDQIVKLANKYNVAGYYSPQDIVSNPRQPSSYDRVTISEMLEAGRDARALIDPRANDPRLDRIKAHLAYSFPTYLPEAEARREGLATLAHELRHAGDAHLTRSLGPDDEPSLHSRGMGENYVRLLDVMMRDRGVSPAENERFKKSESDAVKAGIQPRYIGDPFGVEVTRAGGERLDPKAFEERVLNHPVQDAARRALLQRMAERTPTSGFADGGPVPRSVGIQQKVTMMQATPKTDPRSAALGSRLLKQAGIRRDFSTALQNADPEVVSQVNRILNRGPRTSVQSPMSGLGLFMQAATGPGKK